MAIPLLRKRSLLSLSLLFTSIPALATPLGSAQMFNAYGHSGIDYGGTDIEGVIGSGGDITYSGGDSGRYAGSSSPYTLYAGGNVTLNNHNVYNGGIQAGGSVNTTDTTLGGNISSQGSVAINRGSFSSSDRTITSQGDVTLSDFAMDNGSITLGGNFDNNNGSFNGGTLIMGPGATTTADGWYLSQGNIATGPAPAVALIDHQQVYDDLVNASQDYANMGANGSVTTPALDQWTFSGNSGLNIFNFSGSDLANLSSITFQGSRDATYVINVSGTDINFGQASHNIGGFHYFDEQMMVGSFDDFSSRILFNFYEATSLDIYGSLFGTVLAPYAPVTTQNGAINGSLYGDRISGSSQINSISFAGSGSSDIPEPGSLALLPTGLALLLSAQRRRKRATAA